MFTGIVTDIGSIAAVARHGDTRFIVHTRYDPSAFTIGASIAHSGVCLTVVERVDGGYAVEASAETLSKTSLGSWSAGTAVNLERSACLGDEIGGHLVFGHVDGLATVVDRSPVGDSVRFVFSVPAALGRYVAVKGSVALDGVSLTVNEVIDGAADGTRFAVNIIPHTLQHTTFGVRSVGETVNFEADMLARYVARLMECRE